MSVAQIVTRGLGSFGSPSAIVTAGFISGSAPVGPTTGQQVYLPTYGVVATLITDSQVGHLAFSRDLGMVVIR